jgi:hypothetical protein
MGIKGMNKTYIGGLRGHCEESHVEKEATHLYIDANELIYIAVEQFKKSMDWKEEKSAQFENETYRIDKKVEKVSKEVDGRTVLVDVELEDDVAYGRIMEQWDWAVEFSVIDFLEGIKNMTKLEMLVIGFDGVPVHGKIQQQIERRKVGNSQYYYKNRMIFSTAMILPESSVVNAYVSKFQEMVTEFCEGKTVHYKIAMRMVDGSSPNSVTFHKVSTRFSLSNIPGEAEHKILSILREDIRQEKMVGKKAIVWSADSDTIVSVMGDISIECYIRTNVYEGGIKSSALIKLNDFRNNIFNNGTVHQYMIFTLLIQFFGNDYLPEQMNTYDLKRFLDSLRTQVQDEFADLVVLINGTFIINTPVLMKLFRHLALTEYQGYARDRIRLRNTQSNFFSEFEMKGSLGMKREYYTHLYRFYRGNVDPSDEDLYELERDMTVNYLEVFYWYFYYLSGYYIRGNLSNPYYRYSHAPLYESLYQTLRDSDAETHARFNYQVNKELEPIRTTHTYYESLPRFPVLHHYMVLPKEEFNLEHPNESVRDDDVIKIRNSVARVDPYFPMRRKGVFVTHVDRLDIGVTIKRHAEMMLDTDSSLLVSDQDVKQKSKNGFVIGSEKRFNE